MPLATSCVLRIHDIFGSYCVIRPIHEFSNFSMTNCELSAAFGFGNAGAKKIAMAIETSRSDRLLTRYRQWISPNDFAQVW